VTWLVEPWTYPFMRWALACCLVLAGVHAYLGFHVVRRNVLFVDLAMAQAAALGAAVGIVFGLEHGTVPEYLLSAGFALATAVMLATLRGRRVHPEAVIAIVYGLTSAAMFVVLEHSPHGMEEVKHLFVGQVLTVAPETVVHTALLYALIGVVLRLVHSRAVDLSEGRDVPRRGLVQLAFFGSFALVVTSSVSLVGVLLVFALLVLPAVSGLLAAEGTAARLAWGWSLAGVGCLVGLHLAFVLDQPAAPVIVLVLGALLPIVLLVRRTRAPGLRTGSPKSG
jgi:zinc/manganese transport system permease protein